MRTILIIFNHYKAHIVVFGALFIFGNLSGFLMSRESELANVVGLLILVAIVIPITLIAIHLVAGFSLDD